MIGLYDPTRKNRLDLEGLSDPLEGVWRGSRWMMRGVRVVVEPLYGEEVGFTGADERSLGAE